MNFDDKIMSATIEVDGEIYTYGELVGINQLNLSDEYAKQPGRYVYIATIAANAEALYNEAKLRKESLYAEVELSVRAELKESKTTEGMIKSLVLLDKDYSQACDAENEALRNFKILKAISEGLRERGQMLISLGAQSRAELDMTGMSIKERLTDLRNSR